jgi:hypothetical protein
VVEVLRIDRNLTAAEGQNGRLECLLVLEAGSRDNCLVCHAEHVWPYVNRDHARPAPVGVDEHRLGLLLKQAYSTLGLAILVMGIYAGKRQPLSLLSTRCLPFEGIEDVVISVVVLNLHPMGGAIGLESLLAFHGFHGGGCLL